jgi:hypothetical protein
MMTVANVIGFVVSINGIKDMASQLVGSWAGTISVIIVHQSMS